MCASTEERYWLETDTHIYYIESFVFVFIQYLYTLFRYLFRKVFVFSSMHVSGEQLDQYTGVAATLRFPLVQPDDFEDEDNVAMEGGGVSTEPPEDDEDDIVGGDRRRRLSSADELESFHMDALDLGL